MIAIYRNAGPPPHMTDELHMFHDSISGHSGALFIPVSLPYNHSVIAQGRKKKKRTKPSTQADVFMDSDDSESVLETDGEF